MIYAAALLGAGLLAVFAASVVASLWRGTRLSTDDAARFRRGDVIMIDGRPHVVRSVNTRWHWLTVRDASWLDRAWCWVHNRVEAVRFAAVARRRR